MKKPIIGIIPDYKKGSKDSYSTRPHYALRCNYIEMINKAGGTALILPYDFSSLDQYLEMIDGLLVVGGFFDIHPKRYNETNVHSTVTLNETREEFEFELTQKVLKTKKPILGICNGMQLIAVLNGGSLIQDIPSENKNYLNHEQSKSTIPDSASPYHEVAIEAGTILSKIVGSQKIMTNSSHHQAIREVKAPIKITARAVDGIIEAIEDPTHPYCVGVQWHPEFDVSEADRKIFASFIEAAKK